MKRVIYLCSIMLISAGLWSQKSEENIIKTWNDSTASPAAKIEDLAWIAGHWRGKAFGGILDEVWLPPMGESMLGAFKLVVKGKDDFKEILSISETESGSLELSLRHFDAQLVAWEEKEEVLRFPLIAIEGETAYFKSFTFQRVDAEHLNIYVLFKEGGKEEVMKFAYTLQP